MSGRTGIEIHVALSPGQRTVGRILSALHLEKLGAAVAKLTDAVISVDGVERVEPLYEAHFVEATPGVHHVEMSMRGKGGPAGLQKTMTGQVLNVDVEPGKVTVLLYTPRDGMGGSLEIVEKRNS